MHASLLPVLWNDYHRCPALLATTGVPTLLALIGGYTAARHSMGPLDGPMQRCLLMAAECLIAALAGLCQQVGCSIQDGGADVCVWFTLWSLCIWSRYIYSSVNSVPTPDRPP